jgi:hypothetical protein
MIDMKRALVLLVVSYLGVAVMIWAGDRLGHLRFLVLATIGVCGFSCSLSVVPVRR